MPVDFAEIKERHRDAVTVLGPMHDAMLLDQQYIHASASTADAQALKAVLKSFPQDFEIKAPGIAHLAVQVGLNNVMSGAVPDTDILIDPGRHNDETIARTEQENLRADFKGLLHKVATLTTENPIREMVTKMIGLGLGIIAYPQADEEAWQPHPFLLKSGTTRKPRSAKEEEKLLQWRLSRVGAIPWDVSSVHPVNWYFDTYHDPITWGIERKWVSGKKLAAMFPHISKDFARYDSIANNELLMYFDKDVYCVWLNQVPLLRGTADADDDGVAKNDWGVIPYKMAWAGWGNLDERNQWIYKGAGIIRNNRATFEQYWTYLNMMEAVAGNTPFPNYEFAGPNAAEDSKLFKGGYNQKWINEGNTVLKLIPKPDLPAVILQLMEEVKHNLTGGVTPEILTGEYRKDTLGGLQLRRDMALAPFETPMVNGQQAIAAMLMDFAKILKYNLGSEEKILTQSWVKGVQTYRQINRDNLPDLDKMMLTVNFRPLTNADRLMSQEADAKDLELGAIDMHEYRMRRGIENGQEIDDRALEDQLFKHPALLDLDAQIISAEMQAQSPELMEALRMEQAKKGVSPTSPQPVDQGSVDQATQQAEAQGAPSQRTLQSNGTFYAQPTVGAA